MILSRFTKSTEHPCRGHSAQLVRDGYLYTAPIRPQQSSLSFTGVGWQLHRTQRTCKLLFCSGLRLSCRLSQRPYIGHIHTYIYICIYLCLYRYIVILFIHTCPLPKSSDHGSGEASGIQRYYHGATYEPPTQIRPKEAFPGCLSHGRNSKSKG